MFRTCNTIDNLISWVVFDALRSELSLYERSGSLIFDSDPRRGNFKPGHATLGGIGKLTQCRVCGEQAFTGLLTCRARGTQANVVWFDLRSQCENEV